MKNPLYAHVGLAAGLFLLSGTLALSQSSQNSSAAHPHSAAAPHHVTHAKSLAVNEVGSTCTAPCGGPNHPTKRSMAIGNHSGVNPMYGSSKEKSKATTSQTKPYRDPEDMTTRYRPGNNKPKANTKPHTKTKDVPTDQSSMHDGGLRH